MLHGVKPLAWLGVCTALLLPLWPAAADDVYQYGSPSRDGIGKCYMGREIARVMGHQGAGWLERSSREREERTDLLLTALALQPGDVVADIGAGTGYFTLPMARRVGEQGRVLAVDIQPEMLAIIERRMLAEDQFNIDMILGTESDPRLPAGQVDLVLLVDAYHEFSHPLEVMQAVTTSLSARGRVVLVEYRGEDHAVPIKPLHKMTVEQAQRELGAVGLMLQEVKHELPWQHIMIFRAGAEFVLRQPLPRYHF